MDTIDTALALAAAHGLHLSAETATANEAGLDYRVVMADDTTGRRWVLRLPRRADVSEGMAAEARVLDLVSPVLAGDGIAVPDWRVRTPELIAYPALPGSPGLTLPGGEPLWHMDPADPDYAERLGRLLAALHSVAPERAAAAGVEVRTPEQVRRAWAEDVARVCGAFTVAPALAESWQAWLEDDSCWPERTVMTHGEIYPAHVLFDEEGAITGVLDWTTARGRPGPRPVRPVRRRGRGDAAGLRRRLRRGRRARAPGPGRAGEAPVGRLPGRVRPVRPDHPDRRRPGRGRRTAGPAGVIRPAAGAPEAPPSFPGSPRPGPGVRRATTGVIPSRSGRGCP